jgi:hypothetical protein
MWTELSGWGQEPLASPPDLDNERSGSVKRRELLDELSDY